MTTEKRSKKIQVRLTPDEFNQIHNLTSKSKFTTTAQLIRYCVFEKSSRIEAKTIATTNLEKTAQFINQQIRPVGVNLNQIAKSLNSLTKAGQEPEIKTLEATLKRIEKKFDLILQNLNCKPE